MTCKPAAVTSIRRTYFNTNALPRIQANADRFKRGVEPALSELLDDPILDRLLASDRVRRDQLMTLIDTVKERLISL